jgi:cobalt-zinc-cadmium efflux system membrane fusion protein
MADATSGRRRTGLTVLIAVLISIIVGVWLLYMNRPSKALGPRAKAQTDPQQADTPKSPPSSDVTIKVDAEKLNALGLQMGTVRRAGWPRGLTVTGRLELNANRVAHICPLVEGVVSQVCVDLGEDVRKGDILAHIDSRELGAAKLKLVENELTFEFAQSNREWTKTISDNTRDLLAILQSGQSIQEVEKQFRDRPIGDHREKLVSACARRDRAEADYKRLTELESENVIPEKELIRAKAEYTSAVASYQALIEQIKFDCQRQMLLAEQQFREAETALAVSRSQLLVLGFQADEVERMDPIGEGGKVAMYAVRAPFDGTIIGKHAVLSEHVDQQAQLFELADLSTVWLRADVFEKDLGAVHGLEGKGVSFRTTSYPDREFSATLFSLGTVVDDTTRAAKLLATAENSGRRLKPGMFVEIDLLLEDESGVLQVPASAIQQHEDRTFVFVRREATQFDRRDVRTGRSHDGMVEIVSGLREGEPVAIEGGFALKSEMLSDLMVEE